MIGEKIRKLRKENQVTQEVLAAHLRVTYQAVSKWETGRSEPDILLLPQIANFFHVSIDELFEQEDSGERK